MENDFDSKLKIQRSYSSSNGGGGDGAGNVHRSKNFALRAPRENYKDFQLDCCCLLLILLL